MKGNVDKSKIRQAAILIKDAQYILITAGAGLGVDSGLPDFRGNTGFWRAHPCYEQEGLGFMDLANPKWFETDIKRAWGFYGYRYKLYKKTVPHVGYDILLQWCKNKDYFVFTSNVDGQFQKVGFSDHAIYECHGTINLFQCCNFSGNCHHTWQLTSLPLDIDKKTMSATGDYPRCSACGGLARPNILMFSDYGWNAHRSSEQEGVYLDWLSHVDKKDLLVIELGAGVEIPTVRMESHRQSGNIIRINPDDDSSSNVLHIKSGAKEALLAIDAALQRMSD